MIAKAKKKKNKKKKKKAGGKVEIPLSTFSKGI